MKYKWEVKCLLEYIDTRVKISHPNQARIWDKIFAIAGAKMFYARTLEDDVAQQPEVPYCVSNTSEAIVNSVLSSIHATERNIIIDN